MVMSLTDSGKTILAMFLIHEALLRGKRFIFVADRRTLIDQLCQLSFHEKECALCNGNARVAEASR
jgi:superfamily II DNA or RNA helicase